MAMEHWAIRYINTFLFLCIDKLQSIMDQYISFSKSCRYNMQLSNFMVHHLLHSFRASMSAFIYFKVNYRGVKLLIFNEVMLCYV